MKAFLFLLFGLVWIAWAQPEAIKTIHGEVNRIDMEKKLVAQK